MSVRSDSKVYATPFYGILNAQGDFWTPLAFESVADAKQHISDFWRNQPDKQEECLRKFKVVPVRVRLETIDAKVSA